MVYQATDTRIPRSVAIKALRVGRSADPQQRRRFLDEMRNLCRVEHSYVIRVYDTLEFEGELLLVMEHVRGRTLDEILRDGLPARADALRYATELCEALQALHRANLVHRDLKPGNLMVAEDGHVRLMDFGLVSRAPTALTSVDTTLDGSSTTETLSPWIGGTIPYMSPEQLHGQQVGPRSDLFSLGVVLCELFTGEYPFGDKTAPKVIAAIERDPPLAHAPELRRRFFADPIGAVVAQLLEKVPDRRPASAESVKGLLRALDGGSNGPRRFLIPAAGGLLLVAVVGASIFFLPRMRDLGQRGAAGTITRSPQAVNLIERAEGLTREYRWSAALDVLDQALGLDGDSVVALWRKAEVLEAIGRRADAVRTIHESV